MSTLVSKLDLQDHIDRLKSYFARDKKLFLEGDSKLHFRYINKLSQTDFNPPPQIMELDGALQYLGHSGKLKLYEIFAFVKIIRYFIYLKKLGFDEEIRAWLNKIEIPKEIYDISLYFDDKGNLLDSVDERFEQINQSIKRNKDQSKERLRKLLRNSKLSTFLVDTQIHYIDESETLLLRGGFSQVLKGSVVSRSSSGFFYVVPELISDLKRKEADLRSQKEMLIYEYEKKISNKFSKYLKFLSFINREFDRVDHYQARIQLAREKDLEFIKPSSSKDIRLKDFAHPAISDPVLIDLNFDKNVLLITGVNAGGKTMLLKSILSAVFMAKYLIPMRINASNSTIGSFKSIEAIIDDPQSVKNDISTFAGRMQEFSKLFSKRDFIAGVDEIELGTDSDEAASLFKVILENLSQKDAKLIVTTHHKKLASMMAKDDNVELLAAIYDEERERPTFEFLEGTIGKSYAFETAKRYGIPPHIVKASYELHGKDQASLNDLIQKNIDLELDLKRRLQKIKKEQEEIDKLKSSLKELKQNELQRTNQEIARLESAYQKAIDEAKSAIKENNTSSIHKSLNIADKKVKEARGLKEEKTAPQKLEIADHVKYQNSKGEIISIKKNEATILCDGIKMRVPLSSLRKIPKSKKPKPKVQITIQKPSSLSVELDLHGLRVEEALERLDAYLSDALLGGLGEVLIYHGIGSGKLAYGVKEFLKTHPRVRSFSDAPANMGGMGATVVKL